MLKALGRLLALALVLPLIGMQIAAAQAAPETRLALVISQTNYSGNLSRVSQAEQEADLVAGALGSAKFAVTRTRDLDQAGLKARLNDFRRAVEQAGPNAVGFVYYTGHGVAHPQTQDSYLLGVDARLQAVSDLPAYGVDLQTLRDSFGATGAKAIILVFDACRDTPGLPGWKSGTKGIRRVEASADMLIAYSTGLNSLAEEGRYAPVLAEELRRPGQTAEAAFAAVQRRVADMSARAQLPWFNPQLYKQICFISCPGSDGVAPSVTPVPVASAPAPAPTPVEARPSILTFEPMTADSEALGFEIPPCVLNRSTLECTIWVTAKQKYPWYFNDRSHLLDENGGMIQVSSMTIGGESRTTAGWGYKVEWIDLTPGSRTRIIYRFSGVRDPQKLQALVISLLANKFATIRWDS